MLTSPAAHDRDPDTAPTGVAATDADAGADPDVTADAGADADDASTPEGPFGSQEPTRFAADVEYRGRADGHEYVVRVQHRFLDSRFTVDIDGVEHDPVAEEKARKHAKKAEEPERSDDTEDEGGARDPDPGPAVDAGADDDADVDAAVVEDPVAGVDDLRFQLGESFTSVRCTVRRRTGKGGFEDAETIVVITAGLGGAGEVDVRHGLERTLLAPTPGSPSAMRDEKRTAKPTRYALLAALGKAAGYLIPLLGIGALFSGVLDPVKEWVGARIRPVVEAVDAVVQPVKEWLGDLLRPVQEVLAALFAPVGEAIAAILEPLGRALGWLKDVLFGWIPDLSLPFSIPGWVVDLAVPVLIVLAVFLATFNSLRRRRQKLEATRAASISGSGGADATDGAATGSSGGAATGSSGDAASGSSGDASAGSPDDASPGSSPVRTPGSPHETADR